MKRKRLHERKIIILKSAGKKAQRQGFLNYTDDIIEGNSKSDETDVDSSEESDSEDDISLYSSMESDEDTDSDEVGGIVKKVSNAYGNKDKSKNKGSSNKAENVKVNKKVKDFINCSGKAKHKELDYANRKRKKSKSHHQEPRYCKKELKVALEVIKKVMKMEEAEPFNIRVDPIASGKLDYFNVINTPMDFSTICSNIQSHIKYMNAKDVLKDVEIIWENCCKYNKKGELILILMNRVKKKFMKYWTAAGLCIEHGRKTKDDSDITSSRNEPRRRLGSMIGSPAQVQPDNSLPSRLQLQFPSPCCSHPYQPLQPQPSATQPESCQFSADCGHLYTSRSLDESQYTSSQCHLQQHQSSYEQPHYLQPLKQSTSQVNYSQLQDDQDIGYTHLPPHKNSAVKQHENMSQGLVDSMITSRSHSQPQQPQMNYNRPNHLQKQSQTQPSPTQAGADVGSAGHSNHLPRYPVDPMVVNPSQLQHQQPTPRHNQPSELQDNQESFGKPQPSQPRASIHIDCADSSIRDGKSTEKCEVDPMICSPSKQPQVQFSPTQPLDQPQQPSQSILQPNKLPQPSQSKRKGRGPSRCLFPRGLPEGERIKVPMDSLGEPIGPASTKLASFLGIIARDGRMAPLIYVSWKAMPRQAKEEMWKCVQSRFIIDPFCKEWVLNKISRKWRSWKSELKRNHYNTHQTDEERLKDRNPRVLPDQWPVLLSIWNSEKGQMISAINKAIRAKHLADQTSGRKGYARIEEEEQLLEQAKQQKSLEDSDDSDDIYHQEMEEERNGHGDHNDHMRMASEGRKTANNEVTIVLKKMKVMEQKYAQMETLIARLASRMERFLDEKHISSAAPSKTSGDKQVPNTSDALENSPQLQLHSATSSDEAIYIVD